LALTIIGNDDGAVLMDTTSGYALQGCRGFASAADAEAFLVWYAGPAPIRGVNARSSRRRMHFSSLYEHSGRCA
jgi:hypothetical protein